MCNRLFRYVLAFVSLASLAATSVSSAAEFRAGAAVIDITPVKWPVVVNGGFLSASADKAVDPINARCLVLDDGKTTVAICIVDSCVIPHELVNDVRQKIEAATGIPAANITISATHTHSAPSLMPALGTEADPEYPAFLTPKLVEAVTKAQSQLVPARAGWTVVKDFDDTFCRQWIYRPDRMLTDPFGEQTVRVNMHPGHQNANVIGPSGPVDPDLSILSVQTAAGKPLALLANYSMHYFGSPAVSADYFGRFCEQVQKKLVPDAPAGAAPFVAMMSQGTSGDLMWPDFSKPEKKTSVDRYASRISKLALEAYEKIEYRTDVPLAIRERDVKLNLRVPDEKRLAWSKGVVDGMKGAPPKTLPEVYAREAIELAKNPTRDVKVSAIRIGDLGIATISCEVFGLTGLKIKAHSPFAQTFNIELANGEDGYIPPAELHPLGGYTTWPARTAGLEVGAEAIISETAIALLEEVAGRPRKQVANVNGKYAERTIADKPAAYWRMNEFGGPTIADASGNKLDATVEPGVLFHLDGPEGDAFSGPGTINRALHFVGGRMTTDVKDLGPAYSVEMWFWNGLPGEAREVAGYLFSRGNDGDATAAGDHLGIGGTAVGKDQLIFFNGNKSNQVLSSISTIKPKTWNHAVLVRDGKRVAVYLNGNPQPEISGEVDVTVPSGSSKLFLGGRNDKMFGLEGKMDEIAIFNRALTAEEATARYKLTGLPIGKFPVQLVAPRSPQEQLKSFKLPEGYEVELVAAEPLVTDPVAFAWGPDGKLWVAEMSDYPLGLDDKGKPGGIIRYLEDTDGDGKYDKSTAFMESVNFPTGVMPWRDGVLVTAAPEIFFAADRDGDGKAEVKEVLYVGFTEGNTQLRINGLKWGLDNWVYLANGWSSKDPVRSVKTLEQIEISGRDLRIRPDEGLLVAETGMTEFGRERDDWGNWFGCNNSYPVWHFVLSDPYTRRNPHVSPPGQIFMMTAGNPRVFPISKEQKRYHSFGHAGHYTSACSTIIYRDEALFPRDGKTWHHFICEPMHNVVQHLVSKENGATFTLADRWPGEEKMDFLASDDEWFRPTNLATGPNGALYVSDMYRYMIEHPDWLPPEGAREWKPYYRTGHELGRIWRVVKTGQKTPAIPRLDKLSGAELAAALDSPNGWQRDMVHQLIVWRKDTAATAKLEQLLTSSGNAFARVHALCVLDGMNVLKPELLVKALGDTEAGVRQNAVRIAERIGKPNPPIIEAAAKLVDDPSAKVRLQLAYALGEWTDSRAGQALAQIAVKNADDVYISAAVMSSAVPHYAAIVDAMLTTKGSIRGPLYRNLLNMGLALNSRDVLARLLEPIVTKNDKGNFTGDQLIAWAGWLDLLTARKVGMKQLTEAGGDRLTERLATSDALTDAGREAVIDDSRPVEVRAAGARLLAREPKDLEGDLALLAELLTPQTPPGVQRAVVRAISRGAEEKTPAILTSHWNGLSPEIRVAAVDLMIANESWAFALLQQVEAGKISNSNIDVSRRARLDKLNSPRITALAAKVLGETSNAARAKVVESYDASLHMTGDVQKGLRVYIQNCAVCHKYGEQGNELGPDLRSVRDWTPEAILANVLDPNQKVEPKYLSYTATLNSGEAVFGIIIAEAGGSIVMKGLDGKETTMLRAEIKSLEGTNRSLMPDGLESAINKQQMADLIRFLKEPPQ